MATPKSTTRRVRINGADYVYRGGKFRRARRRLPAWVLYLLAVVASVVAAHVLVGCGELVAVVEVEWDGAAPVEFVVAMPAVPADGGCGVEPAECGAEFGDVGALRCWTQARCEAWGILCCVFPTPTGCELPEYTLCVQPAECGVLVREAREPYCLNPILSAWGE